MKISTLSVTWILTILCGSAFAQTTSPDASQPICPSTSEVVFQLTDPTNYDDLTISKCVGCTIVANLDNNGFFGLVFTDVKGPHTLELDDATGDPRTITFNVSSLAGITPSLSGQPALFPNNQYPGNPPSGYQAVLNVDYCSTTPVPCIAPQVYYQFNGANYGSPMRQYGWTLPKGWSLNDGSTTTVSTGQSIYTSTTNVGLTPDPINGAGGEIDFWALPNCAPAPTADVTSNHLKVLVLRDNSAYPPTVAVNGLNPITVNCGDNSDRIFTVTNVVSSCVTGYKWAIPNGWLYNGAVTTGPVTTTNGTITLTPNPNGTPGNVSVTLMINGVAVNSDTYTEAVNYTVVPPATTISGPVQFCTSGTFSVAGLPAGSGVSTFTITPINLSGSVTGSGSGNSYTINQNGASGTVSVTASTPTPCGTSVTPPITVYVGLQTPTSIICETAGLPLNSNDVYTFVGEIYPSDPSVTYFWSVSGGTIQSGQGASQCNVLVAPYYGPKGTYGDCRVSLSLEKTGCPEGPWLINNYPVALSGGPEPPDVLVTPNPASDHVSLSLPAVTSSAPMTKTEAAAMPTTSVTTSSVSTPSATTGEPGHIKLVKLYDVTGRLQKTSMYPATGIREVLDLKDLPSGVYFIQVFTDKNTMYTQKVLVRH